MIQAVITDIEGTTSDIRFVHEVLFPYARQRLAEVVHRRANDSEIAPALQALRTEIGRPDADGDDLLTVLYGFMAEDRKSPALKTLQGIIWRDGYRQGDFFGHVYDDVVPQLTAWRRQGVALGVYSSGSVEAQQLLFGHSDKGDLRWLFSHYFDTRVGAKRQSAAYQAIAAELALPPAAILFLSDIYQELDAACDAGWRTCQLIRDDHCASGSHPQARRFDEITLQEFV
ncbi:acireductone synthase [Sodalis sp. (in: enterobacteria)]|uniref:acireductone synthase n=1 Tax=Sodalis sp. (in: enterobacteria) TaxID=1898979 RepID=UPI003F3BFEB2